MCWNAMTRTKNLVIVVCARSNCFKKFIPVRSIQKYCSRRCREAQASKRYHSTEKFKVTQKKYLHSEQGILAQKNYEQSNKGKEASRRAVALHIKKYPDKRQARNAISHALTEGKLIRPVICSICNKPSDLVGKIMAHHHNGYDKEHWLDVIWVCVRCHRIEHAK